MCKTSCAYVSNRDKCFAEDTEMGCLCKRQPKARVRKIQRAWVAWRSGNRFQPRTHLRMIKTWQAWNGEQK